MDEPTQRPSSDGRLLVTSPAPLSDWRDEVKSDPHALIYQSPEWVDCLCRTGGYENATRLYSTRDGRSLILPLVRRPLAGGALARQWSMVPGWGTGGVVSSSTLTAEDLASIYADLRSEPSVLRTFIQPSARRAEVWAAADMPGVKTVPRLDHALDLAGGFDTVWTKRFTGSARTAVRKAEKSGVVVDHDTTGRLLPEFYELLQTSVERWARQQHEPLLLARWRARRRDSLQKFQAIAAAVPAGFNLYLARHEGAAVAGILVYHAADAMYSRGAMLKEVAGPVRANYLLHRVAIEAACRDGCGFYDFGESGTSSQLAQFKTRFGATPAPYQEYVVERLPLTEADRFLRRAIKRGIGFREPGAATSPGTRQTAPSPRT